MNYLLPTTWRAVALGVTLLLAGCATVEPPAAPVATVLDVAEPTFIGVSQPARPTAAKPAAASANHFLFRVFMSSSRQWGV